MSDFDKFVKLLAQTDGRDKIYKFLGGILKILASIDAMDTRVKAYKGVSASITDGRSLMRMAKWSGDIPKMRAIISQFHERRTIEVKKLIELLRVLGNFLYVMGDNIAFFMKYRLVPGQAKQMQSKSKIAQFWGFFLACVLDVISLQAAVRRRASDPAVSRKEAKAALISLMKDTSDVLVTMATVGYMRGVWQPSPVTTGALTALSGGVATYLNWKKIK